MRRLNSIFSALLVSVTITALWGTSAQAQVAERYVVFPFPDSQVTLAAGTPWKVAETRVSNYLNVVNVTNFLYAFHQAYGLPVTGMSPCTVWEAPNCNLRGHATGHLLSALSLNYAATKNAAVRTKMQRLIIGLDSCQKRAVLSGYSAGCLSAFGESLFTSLENGGCYGGSCNPNVWAPWYSQHKILAGLISCYLNAGDTMALRMARGMGTWAYNRLSKLSAATLQSMWTRYIAGEYGGYNEAAAELYMITGDTTYRRLAQLFDETTSTISLGNLAANTDNLGGQHANQLMPRIIGYLRVYDATGTAMYLNAATNFWDMVDSHHRFAFGGVSTVESFLGRDAVYANIQVSRTNETCPSYNLVKLSRVMFYHNPQAKYMDYWERANSAQILANANVSGAAASATQPFAAYMTNAKCGESKAASSSGDSYDIGDLYAYTCCDGTSLESHVRYYEGIYGYSVDTLYVNQFIASTLNWTAKGKTVSIVTTYPVSDSVTITVTGAGSMPIKIRSPWWVRRPILIFVNGTQKHLGKVPPATYFKIDATRGWSGSGTITIVMPKTLRAELCNDRAATGNVMYGGLDLYGVTTNTAFQTLDCSAFTKGTGLTWTTSGGFTFKPFYNVASDHYSMYWNVTNVPANWQDTVLDQVNDPPVSVMTPMEYQRSGIAVPAIKIFRSQVRISFASPFKNVLPLHVQIFNVQGSRIADLAGTVYNGECSVLWQQKTALPAGFYMCTITAGPWEYRVSLVSGK